MGKVHELLAKRLVETRSAALQRDADLAGMIKEIAEWVVTLAKATDDLSDRVAKLEKQVKKQCPKNKNMRKKKNNHT